MSVSNSQSPSMRNSLSRAHLQIGADPRRRRSYRVTAMQSAVTLVISICFSSCSLPSHGAADTNPLKPPVVLHMSDVATKIAVLPQRDHYFLSLGIDFSPDGKRLAVVAEGQNLDIWDWRNKRIEKTLETARGSNNGQASKPIAYSADGSLLVNCDGVGLGDVAVRIWDTGSWRVAKDISDSAPGQCKAALFSLDSQILVRAMWRLAKNVKRCELVAHSRIDWKPLWALQLELSPEAMALSPDGKYLAVGGVYLHVFDDRPMLPQGIPYFQYEPQTVIVRMDDHTVVKTLRGDAMDAIAWNSDGTKIAVQGRLFVEIFNVATGQQLLHERTDRIGHRHVLYTPDGQYLVESDFNGRGRGLGVNIWDPERKALRQHISGDSGDIALSRDGKYLGVASSGRTTIWQFK